MYTNVFLFNRIFKKSGLRMPIGYSVKKASFLCAVGSVNSIIPNSSRIHYEYTYLRANSGTRTHISFFPQKRRKTVVQCSTLCRLQGRILNV